MFCALGPGRPIIGCSTNGIEHGSTRLAVSNLARPVRERTLARLLCCGLAASCGSSSGGACSQALLVLTCGLRSSQVVAGSEKLSVRAPQRAWLVMEPLLRLAPRKHMLSSAAVAVCQRARHAAAHGHQRRLHALRTRSGGASCICGGEACAGCLRRDGVNDTQLSAAW